MTQAAFCVTSELFADLKRAIRAEERYYPPGYVHPATQHDTTRPVFTRTRPRRNRVGRAR